jgi:diacylglycerol kinase family enzyme
VGLDSRVGVGVHEFDKIPVIGRGKNAYIVSALVNFCRKVTDDLTVTMNGQTFQGEMTAVCVCNGTWYGGSFNPVPEARPDDGILDVLIVRGVKRVQLPLLFMKYGAGRYREMERYITHVQTKALRIQSDDPFVVNLDGEGMFTDDAEIAVIPGGLRFLHPKNMDYFKSGENASAGSGK